MRQRVGEIHAACPGRRNLSAGSIDLLAQSRQRHRNLDGGAGLEAAAGGDLLVHHGQDAAGDGIDHHHRSVVRTQRFHGGAADGEILAIDVVAHGGIGISRFRPGSAGDYTECAIWLCAATGDNHASLRGQGRGGQRRLPPWRQRERLLFCVCS